MTALADVAAAPVPVLVGALAVGVGLVLAMAAVLLGRPAPAADRRLATYFGDVTQRQSIRGAATTVAGAVVPDNLEARLARRLVGAGLGLRPAEFILLHVGFAVVLAAIGVVAGGPLLAVTFLVIGVVAPLVYLRVRHHRRLAAFASQLPDTLTIIANSLSAGLTVGQAIDTVVRDGQDPIAGELRRALIEQQLGVSLDDALDGIASRMGSVDFAWVVMAIRIQREVGGNLAEVLLTVADTLREREYVRRQVRTLSAEGRLSAYILGALPVGMFVYLQFANPSFIRPLYTELLGGLLLGVAVVLFVGGSWLMARIVKVEV